MSIAAAFHWSREAPADRRTILIAALGMVMPVVIGLAAGRTETGFMIGLGAMLLAGAPSGQGTPDQERPTPATAALPAMLAVAIAAILAGRVWGDAAIVLLAGIAASATSYSRPLAVAAIRFIIYLVLSAGLVEGAGAHRGAAALLFGLGALWNVAVRMLLDRRAPPAAAPPARNPTAAQRRAHWRRSMRSLAGWQFPIRLAGGLAVASVLRHLWPSHHYGWIVLTVALLTQRAIEHVPVKAIQRAAGTVIGVALTWLVLASTSAPAVLAVVICLLATAAPIARAANYLAYAAIATPAILLVIDLGHPIAPILLADRLVATLLGAAIVVIGNGVLDRAMRRSAAAGA